MHFTTVALRWCSSSDCVRTGQSVTWIVHVTVNEPSHSVLSFAMLSDKGSLEFDYYYYYYFGSQSRQSFDECSWSIRQVLWIFTFYAERLRHSIPLKESHYFENQEHFHTMHILHIWPMKQRLDRPCFDGPFNFLFLLIKHCISFPFVVLSLVLSRNSQLHTTCYKWGVFLYFKYAVGEWFKKIIVLSSCINGRMECFLKCSVIRSFKFAICSNLVTTSNSGDIFAVIYRCSLMLNSRMNYTIGVAVGV